MNWQRSTVPSHALARPLCTCEDEALLNLFDAVHPASGRRPVPALLPRQSSHGVCKIVNLVDREPEEWPLCDSQSPYSKVAVLRFIGVTIPSRSRTHTYSPTVSLTVAARPAARRSTCRRDAERRISPWASQTWQTPRGHIELDQASAVGRDGPPMTKVRLTRTTFQRGTARYTLQNSRYPPRHGLRVMRALHAAASVDRDIAANHDALLAFSRLCKRLIMLSFAQ